MKKLSSAKIQEILSLAAQGLSSRDIATRVGVSHTSVNNVRRKYGSKLAKPPSGRPKKLNSKEVRFLSRSFKNGSIRSLTHATQEVERVTGKSYSTRNVRRRLKEAGLKAYVKKKKPFLSLVHRRKRLDFARKYQCWTIKDWMKVIWSDETKINRIGSDGRSNIWRNSRNIIQDDDVSPSLKFGGGSLMFWGCFTAKGVGCACRIHGNLDSDLYVAILEDELLGTLRCYEIEKGQMTFQHDNDPKHTSKKVKNRLLAN